MEKIKKIKGEKNDFVLESNDVIRKIRYTNATIVNLSMSEEDVTFSARNPSSYNSAKIVSKWAHFDKDDKNILDVLNRGIDENAQVNLLVHRYLLIYKKKGSDEKNHSFWDVIISATMA